MGAAEAKQKSTMSADGLERCSSCYIPTSWLALPLVGKREYNYDTTIYTFGLPEGQSLELPVCACILLKAPGKGRKEGGGKDDFDGSDAVRPYTPMSDNAMLGKFELLVKRYDGGAVSQYLHGLPEGEMVEFKHIVRGKGSNTGCPPPPRPIDNSWLTTPRRLATAC